MDAHEVLGVRPDAGHEQLISAYRDLAKRHHPDVAGPEGARRMAEINAAYAELQDRGRAGPAPPDPRPGGARRRAAGRPHGHWLDPATRARIPLEVLENLVENEPVLATARTATAQSQEALLVATDRRLLWYGDDALVHRVHQVPYAAIATVDGRLSWPRRTVGVLRVRRRNGRRVSFGELAPASLDRLLGAILPRVPGHGAADA
jgi:hypothetical protein